MVTHASNITRQVHLVLQTSSLAIDPNTTTLQHLVDLAPPGTRFTVCSPASKPFPLQGAAGATLASLSVRPGAVVRADEEPGRSDKTLVGMALVAAAIVIGLVVGLVGLGTLIATGLGSIAAALPDVASNSLKAYANPPSFKTLGVFASVWAFVTGSFITVGGSLLCRLFGVRTSHLPLPARHLTICLAGLDSFERLRRRPAWIEDTYVSRGTRAVRVPWCGVPSSASGASLAAV